MRRVLQVVVLAAAQALASKEEPKIYECKNANGDVVYQDDPCPDPPRPRAKPQSPQISKSPRTSKSVQKQKALQSKKPMATPNSTAATKHQESPKPQWVVIPRSPARSAAPPLSGPVYRGGPVDARWQTPRKTLKTFLEAVTAGDRSLVWECLTSKASNGLAPDAGSLPLEKLKETIDLFTGYVDEGDLGPFWSIRALRSGTRPKWILFERTRAGEWKIAGI